jgi:hypothetical protein
MLMRIRIAAARCALAGLAALASLISPAAGSAQTVYDPTTAEFGPSPDHSATSTNGTPLVSYYLLEIFPVGSSQASYSIRLGKPAPGSDGLIRVAFVPLLAKPLTGGINYQARVSAVGPGGATRSQTSNVFASSASAPCAPSLSTRTLSVPSTASSGSLNVTAGTACKWTASSNASWLTVTSSPLMTGSGRVTFTVAANSSQSVRTGTLTIAGITFTVTQSGTCAYTVTPASVSAPAAGGAGTFSVSTKTGCAWTATGLPSWIKLTSAGSTGTGTLRYTIAANIEPARTVTLTIAGKSIVIKQSAPVVPRPTNFRIVTPRGGSAPQP